MANGAAIEAAIGAAAQLLMANGAAKALMAYGEAIEANDKSSMMAILIVLVFLRIK
jgi:hypothetical protein